MCGTCRNQECGGVDVHAGKGVDDGGSTEQQHTCKEHDRNLLSAALMIARICNADPGITAVTFNKGSSPYNILKKHGQAAADTAADKWAAATTAALPDFKTALSEGIANGGSLMQLMESGARFLASARQPTRSSQRQTQPTSWKPYQHRGEG